MLANVHEPRGGDLVQACGQVGQCLLKDSQWQESGLPAQAGGGSKNWFVMHNGCCAHCLESHPNRSSARCKTCSDGGMHFDLGRPIDMQIR
eukprot:6117376-Amphidinium_carterae.1